MDNRIRAGTRAVGLSLIFLSGLAAFAAAFPQEKELSSVQKAVEQRLEKRGLLAANHIQVSVEKGVITLSGTVQTLAQKSQAGREAGAVKGHFTVQNNLTLVESSLTPEQIAVNLGTALEKSSFYGIFDWCGFRIDTEGVLTLMGWVYLTGHVAEYVRLAESQPGVTKVVNELRQIMSSDPDNVLRLQVARLIYIRPMAAGFARQPGPIHILVDNGTVTLAGTVSTEGDIRSFESLVRSNTGALAVINELKVRPKK